MTTEPFLSLLLQGRQATLMGMNRETWSSDALLWHADSEDGWRFEVEGVGGTIAGRVVQEACNDGMSDVIFAWSAALSLPSGERLHGCGGIPGHWPIAPFVMQTPAPEEAETCAWQEQSARMVPRKASEHLADEEAELAIDPSTAERSWRIAHEPATEHNSALFSVFAACESGFRRIYGPHDALSMRLTEVEDHDVALEIVERFLEGPCSLVVRTRIVMTPSGWRPHGITCALDHPDPAHECTRVPPLCNGPQDDTPHSPSTPSTRAP